jgi:hypothetical protein
MIRIQPAPTPIKPNQEATTPAVRPLRMPVPMKDTEFLLYVLRDGNAHTLNEILRRSYQERGYGLTVHSRAADLRRKGYDVQNGTIKGAKRGDKSFYKLVA